MRNYKAIGDLDVDIDRSQFDKLRVLNSSHISFGVHPKSKEDFWELELSEVYSGIKKEEIEFKMEIYSCDPDVGYFGEEYKLSNIFGNKEKYIEVDEFGNQHYSLETTLVFKQRNNRPKDQSDIAILKKVLNKEQ